MPRRAAFALISASCLAVGLAWAATPDSGPVVNAQLVEHSADAKAVRTGDRYATDPNGCGFRAGLYLTSVSDDDPELVLHRFDGDVTDDVRFSLPAAIDNDHVVIQSHDCTSALLYPPFDADLTGLRVWTIDLGSGAATQSQFAPIFEQFPTALSALPSGGFIDWIDDINEAVVSIDPMTGAEIDRWVAPGTPGFRSDFSVDGSILASVGRLASAGDNFVLRKFHAGETSPRSSTTIDLYPGGILRLELSPNGEYTILEGALPGVFVSRLLDGSGNTVVDFTDDLRSVRATFVGDDEIILCRRDGAYRSDLQGNEQLIESFPTPEIQEDDGRFMPFSIESSACIEALDGPGGDRFLLSVS